MGERREHLVRFYSILDELEGRIGGSRCADRKEGWVFPSRQKGKHITGGLVNKQWVRARKKAGLPEDLVLYCARHDFGTYVLQKTGNIALS